MHPVIATSRQPGAHAGFTLIEALVAMAVLGILMAVGIPRMGDWVASTKAAGAAGFYAEGFTLARTQALANNSQSRLVFSTNANGQPDWQIDVCFESSTTPCSNNANWTTLTSGAKGAPGAAANVRSIKRSAHVLPSSNVLAVTLGPSGGDSLYFTPLGWVDTSRAKPVTRIDLAPATAMVDSFKPSRVALTMLGVTTVCDPAIKAAGDSRRCAE